MRPALVLAFLCTACSGPSASDAGTDARPDAGLDAGPPPPSRPAPEPLIELVDPFLGTGGIGFNDIGSTFPGPTRPDTSGDDAAFGFVHCSGFAYGDAWVTGLSHTRMNGTGIADYGGFALMPVPAMEPSFVDQDGSRSRFVEGTRVASPGYFAMTLERGSIGVELTSSDRVAFHRYRFGEGEPLAVLVDVGHRLADDLSVVDASVEIDAEAREVRGFSHFSGGYSDRFGGMPVYFVARFDRAFAEHGVWQGETLRAGETTATGTQAGAWLSFDPAEGNVVRAEVAISFVDVEGAARNLESESAAFDFDRVREESEEEWERWLGRVRIHARQDEDFSRFYTALYHVLAMPTLAMDADGRYRGIDQLVHSAEGYRYYTDFSLWDTFRTLHPLLTLLYPEAQLDMLRSLAAMAVDGGVVPRWPLGIGETGGMLGDPGAIVLADSWIKGIRDFDLRSAYDALRRSADGRASERYEGRGNAEIYASLGYVPIEAGGSSASKTLEFAYADYALSILAAALGETEDAARYAERAGSWRNTWDASRGFFVGRHEDGSFVESFREDRWQGYYAEGNAWQYVWYVPHDLEGLAELMGGRDAMLERLRLFWDQSARERRTALMPEWYWHGNEPDLHASFIFAALGEPAESARWSRWVVRTLYGDGPQGLPGNDDGGTLSAWLVFASLGLLPIAAQDSYLLGSPIVTHAELAIGGGVFTIDAPDASEAAIYVGEATIDGVRIESARLPHASIRAGSTLELEMRGAP
jgi:predicted alpha-1,2-mannosidase